MYIPALCVHALYTVWVKGGLGAPEFGSFWALKASGKISLRLQCLANPERRSPEGRKA